LASGFTSGLPSVFSCF